MSVGIRQPGVQRQTNIGPYIIGAAAIHSLVLVAGMFMFVEYQKAQVKAGIEHVQSEIKAKATEQLREKNRFDEPADRRGLK